MHNFFRTQLRNLTQAQKGYTAKWTERQEEQKRKEKEEEERILAEIETKRIWEEKEVKRLIEEEEERIRKEVQSPFNNLLVFRRLSADQA